MRAPAIRSVVAICLSLPPVVGCDLLAECVTDEDYETNPNCEDPERGHITGTITLPAAGGQSMSTQPLDEKHRAAGAALRRAIRDAGGLRQVRARGFDLTKTRFEWNDSNFRHAGKRQGAEWRAGEIIVRGSFAVRGANADWGRYLESALPSGYAVVVDLCNSDTLCLARVRDPSDKPASVDEIPGLVARLSALEFVRYAEPNLVLRMTKTPNDDYYPFQWHYSAMKLPAAWDITTGSDDVVAAVIDTGIILGHSDLQGRVAGSVDLIDDATVANDGDGRDTNGDDPGDNGCGDGCHSFHGTHVAGTMGAATDNATMVAGVSWAGRLLAVRVLGQGGGSLFDIAAGITWAVGGSVDGVPANATPADVLNLSLGGAGESQAMNDAVQEAVDAGAIVLVAAGNEDDDASGYTPANAPAAITVAALGNTGGNQAVPRRAPYSNYGNVVDIAAPGGDQSVDLDQDGQADGVLSTQGETVEFSQGTSMATPHVAGLAMLMKAINPNLTQTQAKAALEDAADPDIDCDKGCGAGGVDAAKTLLVLQGRQNEPYIVASPSVTRVGRGDKDAIVVFENVGGQAADLAISVGGPNREQVTLSTTGGTVAAGAELRVDLTLDRTGEDEGEVTLTAAYGGQIVDALIQWNADVILIAKSVAVGAVQFDDEGEISVPRVVVTTEVDDYAYKLFNLWPGEYLVIGLSDDDGDEEYEEQEGIGVYPSLQEPLFLTVEANTTIEGADFIVAPGFDVPEEDGNGEGVVGDGCATSTDCAGGLYCELAFPGGYCTADCSVGDDVCPANSACWVLGDGEYYVCLETCVDDGDCRTGEGYTCDADSTCFPL